MTDIHPHQSSEPSTSYRPLLAALGLLAAVYVAALVAGLPQRGTAAVIASQTHAPEGEQHAAQVEGDPTGHTPPPLAMILPFALLLGAIAICPLVPGISHWWESNLHKFYVAGALAALTLVYYLFLHEHPLDGHFPARHSVDYGPGGPNIATAWTVFSNAMFAEFVPFIILLFSLFTISGGIRLEGDLRAHPSTNTAFLAIGSLLASLIGTTGAAMLLIRPLLETNRERRHVQHTVVFFIFIVCNCGGCLLPTGDPPLFLGYLLGVPFLWTLELWPVWAFVNLCLLAIYYLWDRFIAYPREAAESLVRDETTTRPLRMIGLWPNAALLLGVIATVGLLDPGKPFPGTSWHPWIYLREMVQLLLIAASLGFGNREVRAANHFHFGAITEVAVLFFGIFICMQPPLQVLEIRGPSLGLTEPWHYFWATGSLSSFLDNAPTYVVFFETAKSVTATVGLTPTVATTGVYLPYLIAVSLGAVFMGANTYIGNGPNFMVKAIAEGSGVKMPSFFGYMAYSIGILIPLFLLTTLLFLLPR
ncbi:MAG: sodium:proton antiporter [Pirellulales bacterium]|nr:sodium:proton antiporter [Pirellulales bacterium]